MSAVCALWQCLAWRVSVRAVVLRDMAGLWIRTVSLAEKRHRIDKVPNSRHIRLFGLCVCPWGKIGQISGWWTALCLQEQRRMIRQLDPMDIWVLNTSGHYHLWPALYIKPIYHSVCPCCFILQTALSPGQSEGKTFCIFAIWTACLVLH